MKICSFAAPAAALLLLLLTASVNAQIVKPKDVVREEGTNRVNNKIYEGADEGFSKIEEGIGSLLRKKKP